MGLGIWRAFDSEDGEYEIIEEIVRPVAILVSGQRFKNLWIFGNEIGCEVHDEGDAGHLPSEVLDGMSVVQIWFFPVIRKINPAFEVFIFCKSICQMAESEIIMIDGTVIFIDNGIISCFDLVLLGISFSIFNVTTTEVHDDKCVCVF